MWANCLTKGNIAKSAMDIFAPNKFGESIFSNLFRNTEALSLDCAGSASGNLFGYFVLSRARLKFPSHSEIKSKPYSGIFIKLVGSF